MSGIGNGKRLFAESDPGEDPTSFQVDNTSKEYFNSPYYLQHKNQVEQIPARASDRFNMDLSEVLDKSVIQAIQDANKITFHAVGDTGATGTQDLPDEESVADAMVGDIQAGGSAAPSFFFHLGDVVYYFGEGKYYYDQFYDPYRAYNRPIFAVPGNHDGVVYGDTSTSDAPPTLEAFLRNFCAGSPDPSPDAAGLVRSAMTQPGVYFTLDAPMVSIIGLYSNVLEGPGVISSQGGKYPVSDEQLDFLKKELQRLKPSRLNGERAVIMAVHHPPYSVDNKHGGTTGLLNDIDACCQNAGLWPDAVLSGHAHLYQRFTRQMADREIPYVVSGSGGYNAKASKKELEVGAISGDATLEAAVADYGYLTVTVDMTSDSKLLTIVFRSQSDANNNDRVTVDLGKNQVI